MKMIFRQNQPWAAVVRNSGRCNSPVDEKVRSKNSGPKSSSELTSAEADTMKANPGAEKGFVLVVNSSHSTVYKDP